jgi:branched-chain amino acid transport system substrate-binding protein|uniref:ABC transporter substrate-binding protein n=1 Tax=candidate division WOR-3 bacterium TaxID=2052148 RepID=A0A7V3PUQ3_UNCW3
MRLITTILALCLTLGLTVFSCGPGNYIKVGVVAPLTGDVKTFGESTVNGIMLAVEEANRAGGVNGKQIKLFISDDKNDPTEAANAGGKLIELDRVVAIIGSVSTKCSLPLADKCQMARIPMITPTSTNPKVTITDDGRHKEFIFRACFTDSFQGVVAARFAIDSLKAKTAAIMFDVGNDYSRGLADYFRRFFEAAGGKVVAFESYQKDDVDFSALLTKVKQQKPELVFLPDYYNKVGLIVKQAYQLGLVTRFLGGDGWDSPAMLEIAGKEVAGSYFVNHYAADDPRPEVQNWVNKYQARYGQKPDAMATLGYDAALLLIAALRNAPNGKPEEIQQALAQIKDYPCVSGTITFDQFGNPIKLATIIQYTETGQRFVTAFMP